MLVMIFLGAVAGCGSTTTNGLPIGSFRGKSVQESKPPVNGAITTVYFPTYDVGVVFTQTEFSGSQQRDAEEPIIIRGSYELIANHTIRFIAEDFANDVVLLDGVFSYTLVEKTLTLKKQDGTLTLVLTRLPER
jgi:hypothetical protein